MWQKWKLQWMWARCFSVLFIGKTWIIWICNCIHLLRYSPAVCCRCYVWLTEQDMSPNWSSMVYYCKCTVNPLIRRWHPVNKSPLSLNECVDTLWTVNPPHDNRQILPTVRLEQNGADLACSHHLRHVLKQVWGFWSMSQKQQMFCLFPFAARTFRALGLQGLDPGSSFPGIDEIDLALWWTLGYVSDPVFTCSCAFSFVELEEQRSDPIFVCRVIFHPDTTHTYSRTFIIIPVHIYTWICSGPGC